MSLKTLYSIVLNIFGLLFIKEVIDMLPQLYSLLLSLVKGDTTSATGPTVVGYIIGAIIYYWIIYFLLFKTETVLRIFNLGIGASENNLTINIHRSTVLSITILLMGVATLVTYIPFLVRNISMYIVKSGKYATDVYSSYILMDIARVIIGLLLLTYNRKIVNYIELKRKKGADAQV